MPIPGPQAPARLSQDLVHHIDKGLTPSVQCLTDCVMHARVEPRRSDHEAPGTLAVNAYTELVDIGAVLDHNVVKVVVAAQGDALMFSRQPIPYPKGDRPKYLRQLGLYGLTGPALQHFRQLQQGPLERAEEVEMLRFVEHGHAVQMIPVADDGVAVDTPDDLARADGLLAQYAEA